MVRKIKVGRTRELSRFGFKMPLAPIVNLDDCGTGTVTRQFQAVDAYGNISTNPCFQEIQLTIENNYAIKFPRDISINCDQAMDFGYR